MSLFVAITAVLLPLERHCNSQLWIGQGIDSFGVLEYWKASFICEAIFVECIVCRLNLHPLEDRCYDGRGSPHSCMPILVCMVRRLAHSVLDIQSIFDGTNWLVHMFRAPLALACRLDCDGQLTFQICNRRKGLCNLLLCHSMSQASLLSRPWHNSHTGTPFLGNIVRWHSNAPHPFCICSSTCLRNIALLCIVCWCHSDLRLASRPCGAHHP